MIDKNGVRYVPDWGQTVGKVSKKDDIIRIHPYDLIPLVQKKKGFQIAGQLALKILKEKYDKIFDDLRVKS